MTTVYVALSDRVFVSTEPNGDRLQRPVLEEVSFGSDSDSGSGSGSDSGSNSDTAFEFTLECLAASAAVPNRLFVGTFESGLLRSTDWGETVEHVETPFERHPVTALTVSPHDPDTVYAGSEPSALYRSTDAGETWNRLEGLSDVTSAAEWSFPPRPDTHHVRWVAVDPFDPDRLLVGIEAGALVVSPDGGETWIDRPAGSRRDNHTLSFHPTSEGRCYSAAGDGYAESDDGGETWRQPQAGLEDRYCWGLAVDPADPDCVLVSSASGARRAHNAEAARSFVYRKTGSDSWERLDDRGLPMGDGVVRAVLATTGEPEVVYAATNVGLFRSTDFGDSWRPLTPAWPPALESKRPRSLLALVPE